MKLKFDVTGKTQPDPFVFRDKSGRLYLYCTGMDGVHAYSAEALDAVWHYEGIVLSVEGGDRYWAPSVIELGGKYYMYFSYHIPGMFEHMHVAESESPLGPFLNVTKLYDRFTIDSHAVKTEEGLYLFYAENNENCGRKGTRVFVDKLLDPFTPANICKELISPTRDEEISCERGGEPWHTLEGPFYIEKEGWHYVMYSGGAFTDNTYHIGYAAAKSNTQDLLSIDFRKVSPTGEFMPVMRGNEREEGVGHHSVIEIDGDFYAVYHARDIGVMQEGDYVEARTARYCKLNIEGGAITADMGERECACRTEAMAVYDMILYPLEFENEDGEDDFEMALHGFLTALSGNNQVIFETENICKGENSYIVRFSAPFKDSPEEKHDNKYVKERRENLYSLLEKEPELVYIGEDIAYRDSVCGGEEAEDYILCISTQLEDISPVRCGQCWSNIPYYLLPAISGEVMEDIRNWKNVYFAYDKLFYATDIGEMGAHRMMSKVDSKLNKTGMEICRKLEKELGKPVYYYIYRFYGKHSKTCPICGGEWKELKGAITDYRCNRCRIVAHERS